MVCDVRVFVCLCGCLFVVLSAPVCFVRDSWRDVVCLFCVLFVIVCGVFNVVECVVDGLLCDGVWCV